MSRASKFGFFGGAIPRVRHFALFVAFGLTPLCSGPASAALGGDAASILADADELHGSAQFTSLSLYDIHEITTDSGMRVREFLNRKGIVFAVTWDGPVIPDLKSLLGASFESFVKESIASKRPPGVQRSLRVASPDLVVESSGHMRAYVGRAYLPVLVPTGASTADLR